MVKKQNVIWFKNLTNKDVPLVGGKNASLGEMYQKLTKKQVNIPNGYATTASAYREFMKDSGTMDKIKNILKDLNTHDIKNLMERGEKVRKVIISAEFPEHLKQDIVDSYKELSKIYGVKNVDVAVRSSATAEDLPDASFAGQQETYLNIKGEEELLIAVKKCVASLFTNRAISYRADKGFDHFSIALSVGVQKMVRSDLASSGVMFSIDTESGFQNTVLINSIYGLGENIVQGRVTPDEFYYFKPTKSIISKTINKKDVKMVYTSDLKNPVKNVKVSAVDQARQSITDDQVKKLSEWAVIIEKHYDRPMDMEWALDGKDGKLYIVQARPETIHGAKKSNFIEEYRLKGKGEIIVTGQSVGQRIGAGVVNKIMDVKDITKFKKGEVLVTSMTDPDWEPIMKIASAIVTDKGGRTCHAAIVSRELGIPCVVGTEEGSKVLKTGQKVTVNCSDGETGKVHEGLLDYETRKTDIGKLKRPKTKIMMNIGEPELAFSSSFIPYDGVGLARLALINFDKQDEKTKKKIEEVTMGYKDKKQFFVDKLAEGVARISAAFYPNPVIVRLSDFKSNEYANLIGGHAYEPVESNPMIGLEIYVMAEIPANIILAEQFAKIFDGFSIGSNDLTQLMLGIDRDSTGTLEVAGVSNENNEAVKIMIKDLVARAKKTKTKVGICGQAPSDFPEFVKFLVDCGIDSISLIPDTIIKTTMMVSQKESTKKK